MKSRRFYELEDDLHLAGRWHLHTMLDAEGNEQIGEDFGLRANVRLKEPLHFPIQYPGKRLDYTQAGVGIPVMTERLYRAVEPLIRNDVQVFESTVEGARGRFFALNVFKRIKCLDQKKTESFTKKRKKGRTVYDFVIGLQVDPTRVPNDVSIFRVAEWCPPIIVTDRVAEALMAVNHRGVRLLQVC